jgi:energy-coupling factor transport system ATP-binding protein
MNFRLANISFSYQSRRGGSHAVFNDLSLVIESGECVGVMGQEGAGKSTLLQLLDGLLVPQRGILSVNGKEVGNSASDLRDLRRHIGFAFQFPEEQFFCETVEEELRFGPRNLGMDISAHGGAAETLLDEMGMPPEKFLHRSPFSLSMGEARRVALASVLVTRPRALLVDEPTAGLDGTGTELILRMLQKLRADGVTVVVASHDVDLLSELVSRVIILDNRNADLDEPAASVFSDAGKLERYGYELPEVMKFVRSMQSRGYPIEDGFHTREDLTRMLPRKRA